MKRYCNYCCKWIECKHFNSFGGHRNFCKNKEFVLNNLEKGRKVERRNYTLFCKKCGKKYEIEVTERAYQKGNYRKHCSRSCANSRVQTSKMNDSRRIKLKLPILSFRFICNECKKEFEVLTTKQSINRFFCSISCAARSHAREMVKNRSFSDWSKICKSAYKSGNNFVAGGKTKWYNYKDTTVQGTYELRTCYILDLWKELGKIKDWEYTNDRFPYIGIDGKEHMYLLDFKVFQNSSFYYLEVKGYEKENDRLKWESVKDHGYRLEIWFDKDIKKEEARLV